MRKISIAKIVMRKARNRRGAHVVRSRDISSVTSFKYLPQLHTAIMRVRAPLGVSDPLRGGEKKNMALSRGEL